jgi:hypothetical protein
MDKEELHSIIKEYLVEHLRIEFDNDNDYSGGKFNYKLVIKDYDSFDASRDTVIDSGYHYLPEHSHENYIEHND